MLAYTYYETDNRVRRYAETLVRRGDIVDVFALSQKAQGTFDIINGVNVYRIQERIINERGKFAYLYRLLKFLLKSGILLTKKHLAQPYDVVHVHSVPDFEVFAAFLVKLMGAKVILDIHDLVPEFYGAKFGTNGNSMIFKSLVLAEKLSIRFSDHVIISNHIWYDRLISRSVKRRKCTVIMNYPDNTIFGPNNKLPKASGEFKLLYPGTLSWHQGLDVAIKAFARISEQVPQANFYLYGDGPQRAELEELILELGLEDRVLMKGLRPIDEIARIMADADLGIVPKRDDSFGGEAFSTKTLEFMSLGVPIIVSRTRIDKYYFNDDCVRFFQPESEQELADSMLYLITNEDARRRLVGNALNVAAENSWRIKKHYYLDLIDSIVRDSRA